VQGLFDVGAEFASFDRRAVRRFCCVLCLSPQKLPITR